MSVALTAVDNLYSQFLCKVIKGVSFLVLFNSFGLLAREFLFFKTGLGNVKKRLLCKVTDKPRICTVL